MKTKVLLMFCVILIAGCTNQTPKPLTDEEKSAIIKEVAEFNQSSIDAFNKIDFTSWSSYFLDSPDFRGVSIDGSILNYEQEINDSKGFFESVSNLHLTKLSEYTNVLSRDLVITSFQITTNATFKTGETLTFEKLAVTGILRKTNNKWGAIFYLENGLPPKSTK
jgi:hypothetical protein